MSQSISILKANQLHQRVPALDTSSVSSDDDDNTEDSTTSISSCAWRLSFDSLLDDFKMSSIKSAFRARRARQQQRRRGGGGGGGGVHWGPVTTVPIASPLYRMTADPNVEEEDPTATWKTLWYARSEICCFKRADRQLANDIREHGCGACQVHETRGLEPLLDKCRYRRSQTAICNIIAAQTKLPADALGALVSMYSSEASQVAVAQAARDAAIVQTLQRQCDFFGMDDDDDSSRDELLLPPVDSTTSSDDSLDKRDDRPNATKTRKRLMLDRSASPDSTALLALH